MSVVGELEAGLAHYPLLLTVEEVAEVLRISRAHAYALARRYEASDGMEGVPVLRVGNCLRVPRWALIELLGTGRLVRLRDAVDRDHHDDEDSKLQAATINRADRSQRRSSVVSIDRAARRDSPAAEQLALLESD